jgi:hypothetical protein
LDCARVSIIKSFHAVISYTTADAKATENATSIDRAPFVFTAQLFSKISQLSAITGDGSWDSLASLVVKDYYEGTRVMLKE